MTADVFESLSSFFDSPIWGALKILIVVFIILMWLALGIWVYRDARRRNAAPGYPPLMAAVGVLIPFFGPLLYMAVRPGETLSEQRDRQLETRSLEREGAMQCPDCGFATESRYLACPSCMRKLKDPCAHCGEPIDPRWSVCPFCEKVPAHTLGRITDARADMPTELSSDLPSIRPEPAK